MSAPAILSEFKTWLWDDALPFWTERGVDRLYGGFIEDLDFNGADAARDFKRTRVTCRQIYAFAHAKLLGWDASDALIEHGVAFLTDKAKRPDGGFVARLTREGAVLDPTPDLYDNAFAVFAFAWAHRATGDAAYRDLCDETMDFIETALCDPAHGGFFDGLPPTGRRRQNPHMHLFEASIAAYEATGSGRYAARARALAKLFQTRFFDPASGRLLEHFNADWTPAENPDGARTEPGHQFEWIWILERAKTLFDVNLNDEIRALYASAEQDGVDPASKAVFNAVDRRGQIIDGGSRSWTNTERLKAAVARFRLDGTNPWPTIEETGRLLLDRYLSSAGGRDIPRGAWIDAFDAKGKAIATAVPASIFYHLFLAFTEVLSLAPEADA